MHFEVMPALVADLHLPHGMSQRAPRIFIFVLSMILSLGACSSYITMPEEQSSSPQIQITPDPQNPSPFNFDEVRDKLLQYIQDNEFMPYQLGLEPLPEGVAIQEYSAAPLDLGCMCGDLTGDGILDMEDVTFLVNYNFLNGPAPNPLECANINGQGQIDISDLTYLILYLFHGSSEPNCNEELPPSPTPTPTPTPTPPIVPTPVSVQRTCLPHFPHVVPNLILFEKQLVENQTAPEEISITNLGTEPITLTNISVEAPFHLNELSLPIEILPRGEEETPGPGEEVVLEVRFHPTSTGNHEGTLTLSFEGLPDDTVELFGAGLNSIPIISLGDSNGAPCQTLNQAGATYVMQGSAITDGTCYTISAPNITLDLNGQTIRYANGTSSDQYAVLLYPGPGAVITSNATQRGTIVQGSSAGNDSHAIRLRNSPNVRISHLAISVGSKDSWNVAGYNYEHVHIHDNFLQSHVMDISSRDNVDGVLLGTAANSDYRNRIHGNILRGGPQAGINLRGIGSQVYRNNIMQGNYGQDGNLIGETFTNNFAIFVRQPRMEVFENDIGFPLAGEDQNRVHVGRGIMLMDDDVQIFNNRIRTQEAPLNREYGGPGLGCQSGGTYGIQTEDTHISAPPDGGGILIFGNDVITYADACDARALRMSGIDGDDNYVCRNTFRAERVGSSEAFAYGFSGGTWAAPDIPWRSYVVLHENTFTADTAILHFSDCSGSGPSTFSSNFYEKGSNSVVYDSEDNPTDPFLFGDFDTYCGATEVGQTWLLDSEVSPGVSLDNVDWSGGNPKEFFVQWTLDLTLENSNGSLLQNAQVRIQDDHGISQTYPVDNGTLQAALTQYRMANSLGLSKDFHTPHRIFITPENGNEWEYPSDVVMDEKKSLTITVAP